MRRCGFTSKRIASRGRCQGSLGIESRLRTVSNGRQPGRFVESNKVSWLLNDVLSTLKEQDGSLASEGGEGGSGDLALSPLKHPRLLAARVRSHNLDANPTKDQESFRTLMEKNPFACVLAQPVRSCALTSIRLPSPFLTPFSLRIHPSTGNPWLTPETVDQEKARIRHVTSKLAESDIHRYPGLPISKAIEASKSSASAGIASGPPTIAPRVSPLYISTQAQAFALITSYQPKQLRRLLPLRWKANGNGQFNAVPNLDGLVWRQDMMYYALEKLRARIQSWLLHFSPLSPQRHYLQPLEALAKLDYHDQPSAVLWMGEASAASPTGDAPASILDITAEPLPPASGSMIKWRSRVVPFYDLSILLGEERMEILRKAGGPLIGQMAVVKRKKHTVPLQISLWQLAGYY